MTTPRRPPRSTPVLDPSGCVACRGLTTVHTPDCPRIRAWLREEDLPGG